MRLTYRFPAAARRGQPATRKCWHLGNAALTDNEATILLAVSSRPHVGRADLIEMLWPDPDMEPDWADGMVKVFIFRLNRKLPLGWAVRAPTGPAGANRGYRLERLEALAA